jgi:hypothetical protein
VLYTALSLEFTLELVFSRSEAMKAIGENNFGNTLYAEIAHPSYSIFGCIKKFYVTKD